MLVYREVLEAEKMTPPLSGNNYLWLLKLPILVSLPENSVKDHFSHFSWSKLFTSKVLWKIVTQENMLHIKFKPKLQFFTSTSYELTNCIYIPWRTSSSLAKNSLTNFSWIPLHSRNTNKLVRRWFAPWWYVCLSRYLKKHGQKFFCWVS